jgi:hypothetical protein
VFCCSISTRHAGLLAHLRLALLADLVKLLAVLGVG